MKKLADMIFISVFHELGLKWIKKEIVSMVCVWVYVETEDYLL